MMRVEPFSIRIPDEDLADLRARLERTRWPDEAEDAGWDYGTNLAYLRQLVAYWREGFDWRAVERRLNSFSHFRAEIGGRWIHFIREPGVGPHPMPLVVTHGWPSSVAEMLEVIRPLADPGRFGGDPDDAFDVVVPSLPGFGFSDRWTSRGAAPTADLWAALMSGLGYERFGAQGGDVGAGATVGLGRFHADRMIGMHISSDLPGPKPPPAPDELTAAEREYLARLDRWELIEGAYGHQQRTRPQTLGYGLNDSPAGLAGWIVEKFRAWSDCGGDVDRRFSNDDLLTAVSMYWFTQTINSSIRNYYERAHDSTRRPLRAGERVPTPLGVAMFPGERDLIVPREYAERNYDIRRWTDMPRGGHFAALEEPQLLIDDVRAFFREFRQPAPMVGAREQARATT